MARYAQGDRIEYTTSLDRSDIINGVIERVIWDSARHAGMADMYITSNEHFLSNEDINGYVTDPPIPQLQQIVPENRDQTVAEAFQFNGANIAWTNARHVGQVTEEANITQQPSITSRHNWNDAFNYLETNIRNRRQATTFWPSIDTTPIQIEPTIPNNIEGDLPVNIFEEMSRATELTFNHTLAGTNFGGTRHIPILEENTVGVVITSNDYHPNFGRERLIRFRIEDIIISPLVDSIDGEEFITFRDQNGNKWYNSIATRDLNSFSNLRDSSHVRWMMASEYERVNDAWNNSNIKKPNKKKKNLRMKYGKMPVVKEEKYYDSKSYIA